MTARINATRCGASRPSEAWPARLSRAHEFREAGDRTLRGQRAQVPGGARQEDEQNVDRDQARPEGDSVGHGTHGPAARRSASSVGERVSVTDATSAPRSRREPITGSRPRWRVLAVRVGIRALLTAWVAILHGNPRVRDPARQPPWWSLLAGVGLTSASALGRTTEARAEDRASSMGAAWIARCAAAARYARGRIPALTARRPMQQRDDLGDGDHRA